MVNIYILPVSGGGFVSQLAAIQHLSLNNIKPDIMLGSSGGNLAAYIAASADMDPNIIELNSSKLSSKIFVRPWSFMSIISSIAGYFQGNFYNSGEGNVEFIKTCFTTESLSKYEIWTGVFNRDLQKSKFYCNKDSSIFQLDEHYLDDNQMLPFEFMKGDFEKIALVSLASASIPTFVPPQICDGYNYVDGGNGAASPMTCLSDLIYNLNRNEIHMYYINCLDVNQIQIMKRNNLVDHVKEATGNLVKSMNGIDRAICIHTLEKILLSRGIRRKLKKKMINIDKLNLIRRKYNFTLTEFYPEELIELNVAKFTGEDVVEGIRKSFLIMKVRVWY